MLTVVAKTENPEGCSRHLLGWDPYPYKFFLVLHKPERELCDNKMILFTFSLSNLSETQVMVLLVTDTTFGQFVCKYQGNHPWNRHHLLKWLGLS